MLPAEATLSDLVSFCAHSSAVLPRMIDIVVGSETPKAAMQKPGDNISSELICLIHSPLESYWPLTENFTFKQLRSLYVSFQFYLL